MKGFLYGKKMAALALTGTMLCGMLAGCGNGGNATQDNGAAQNTAAAAATESQESTEEKTAESFETEEEIPVFTGEAYHAALPTEAEEAEIYVEPIEGLSEDFIKGMDISSVIAEEESGVVYYDEDGNEADLFRVLADAGVNYIRVRVWNDPYNEDGNGYGGGNNDVKKAAAIGARAAQNGMKLLVDFHYSDFWADPTKQMCPKEWENYFQEEKEQAIYDFTKESLAQIAASGADIGMVQIGNEINNGMAGETNWDNIIPLLSQASKAVRETSADIKVAVHFTDIHENEKIMSYPRMFENAGLDYDVFGVSYYTFWHGTLENLTEVLSEISDTYGKEVAVMETSYAYTTEDGDGFGNSITETDLVDDYAATVQSQANCVRDVMAAAAAAGEKSLGVFYWEGAWVPVGAAADKAENEKLWEKYGSGWASSYAAKYDPNDAGQYYGGSSWDNQAMFDFTGHPLASLNVFKYVNYGTICDLKVDYIEDTVVDVNVGEELVMPDTVQVAYNDRKQSGPVAVTWEESQYQDIDTQKGGDYPVEGTLEDGTKVSCTVHVVRVNWLQNSSFEESDVSMWNITSENGDNPTDIQNKSSDALTGENSLHFWSATSQEFRAGQTVSGLAAGTYGVEANIQGGDVGTDAEIYLYAEVDGEVYQSEPVTLDGWCNWKVPEITGIELDGTQDIIVGIYVKCAGGGWGTIDDFYLYKE